jgi:hypothetical protein
MESNGIQIGVTLGGLGLFGLAYAALVRHVTSKKVEGQTAYLVAVGVFVTVVGMIPVIGLENGLLTLVGFGFTGTPMILEYVLRIHKTQKRDREEAARIAREHLG